MGKTHPHYELRAGVNSIRIGSLMIGAHGHTARNDAEEARLDAHPDLVKKAEKPKETTT